MQVTYVNDLIAASDDELKDFTYKLLITEIEGRKRAKLGKFLREFNIPHIKTFEGYSFDEIVFPSCCNKDRLLSLELITSKENVVMMGNVGTGKTHLSISLGYKAVEDGYKVSFVSMDKLMHLLKTKDISRSSKGKMNKILSSSLVIIDKLGYLPISREEANMFFQLITALHEQASLIITSNKGFEDWSELLGDPALTTAVLDSIAYRCELFNMEGKSFRLEHRESLFKQK